MIDNLKNFASKVYGMGDEDFAAFTEQKEDGTTTIKEDIFEEISKRDALRIKKLKEEAKAQSTEQFNNGFKKAQSEVMEGFEAKLREAFGVSTDAKGDELLNEIKAANGKKFSGKDEDIKTHPMYLELERKKNKELQAVQEQWQAEKQQLESGFQRKQTQNVVKDRANRMFSGLQTKPNPYAQGQFDSFMSEFERYDYQIEGEQIIIIADGKRVEDDHGNPTDFNKFFQDKLNYYFTFPKQDNKGNAGNNGGGGQPYTPSGSLKIESHEAYKTAMLAAKTPEDKRAIINAYNEFLDNKPNRV